MQQYVNATNPNFYLSNEFLTDFKYPLHLHDNIEIAYVTSGILSVQIEDKKYNVKEGELVVILPNNAHLYYTKDHSKCQIVVLSNDFASELVENYSNLQPTNPIIKLDNATDIMKEYAKRKPNYYLIKSITNYIAYKYIINSTFEIKNAKTVNFIHSVYEYIDNNYDKNPTLEELASNFNYTTNYLSTLINNTFDKTFMAMVNEQRIAKAIELLKSTTMTIFEIASTCGYNTVRSFNRNFLMIVGVSPSNFR